MTLNLNLHVAAVRPHDSVLNLESSNGAELRGWLRDLRRWIAPERLHTDIRSTTAVRGQRRGAGRGEMQSIQVSVKVENDHQREVQLIWHRPLDGGLKVATPMATIAPGRCRVLRSYYGHSFSVWDGDDEVHLSACIPLFERFELVELYELYETVCNL